jgi:hypothetical protein
MKFILSSLVLKLGNALPLAALHGFVNALLAKKGGAAVADYEAYCPPADHALILSGLKVGSLPPFMLLH